MVTSSSRGRWTAQEVRTFPSLSSSSTCSTAVTWSRRTGYLIFLREKLDLLFGPGNYLVEVDYPNYTLYIEASVESQRYRCGTGTGSPESAGTSGDSICRYWSQAFTFTSPNTGTVTVTAPETVTVNIAAALSLGPGYTAGQLAAPVRSPPC